jgi:hypothetical protein
MPMRTKAPCKGCRATLQLCKLDSTTQTQKIREIGVSAVKSEIRSSHVTNKIRTADCADCADFFEK